MASKQTNKEIWKPNLVFPRAYTHVLIIGLTFRALALRQSSDKGLTFETLALHQRSDEGLTLETSAFQSLYGGQFTLSTPLINQIFVFYYLYQSLGIFSATLMSLIWMILNVSLMWYTLTLLWRSISDVPQGRHLTGNHGLGKR